MRALSFIGDGFFPIVSREVATRNRKRRKVIHDRQRGRIPGACLVLVLMLLVPCGLLFFLLYMFYTDAPFSSPLAPGWVGFTAEEVAILKGKNACLLWSLLVLLHVIVFLFMWF
jgi:hypothetical protein